MRRLIVAVVGTLVGLVEVTYGSGRWSITPPPGWSDVSAASRLNVAFLDQVKKIETLGGSIEIEVYQADEGESLQVVYVVTPLSSGSSSRRSSLKNFEAGARDNFAKTAPELAYKRLEQDKMVVIDAVAERGTDKLYVRRLVGIDTSSRIVSVSATCTGRQDVCLATNQSLTLPTTTLEEIPTDEPPSYDHSSQYKIGKILGGILLVSLFGWWAWGQRNKLGNR